MLISDSFVHNDLQNDIKLDYLDFMAGKVTGIQGIDSHIFSQNGNQIDMSDRTKLIIDVLDSETDEGYNFLVDAAQKSASVFSRTKKVVFGNATNMSLKAEVSYKLKCHDSTQEVK